MRLRRVQTSRTVANRLGHADPSMTLRVYSHVVEAADRELAQNLSAALDRATEGDA